MSVAVVLDRLLVPRLTTVERDAITAINGMFIYNTTLSEFQGFENGSWTTIAGGGFDPDGAQVFNESGAAVDFRVEGDTNINTLFLDGSEDNLGFGGVAVDTSFMTITPGEGTRDVATKVGLGLNLITDTYDSGVQTGVHAIVPAVYFGRPTFINSGAGITYQSVATVYIENSPDVTDPQISNMESLALWIDDGDCRIDGALTLNSSLSVAAGLQITGNTTIGFGNLVVTEPLGIPGTFIDTEDEANSQMLILRSQRATVVSGDSMYISFFAPDDASQDTEWVRLTAVVSGEENGDEEGTFDIGLQLVGSLIRPISFTTSAVIVNPDFLTSMGFSVRGDTTTLINTSPSIEGLGFFNVTPVNRPGATEDIKDALVSLGLLQGTSATALDLDGGNLKAANVDCNSVGSSTALCALVASNAVVVRVDASNIRPVTDAAQDLGNTAAAWRTLYLTASLELGHDSDTTLTRSAAGVLAVEGTDLLQADGSIALTADWDIGSNKLTAETFESDIVTGTPPLIVASTTVVANLNVSQLEGAGASDFLLRQPTGNVVWNESGGNFDFRMESDDNPNMLNMNAGNDAIAIGGSIPAGVLFAVIPGVRPVAIATNVGATLQIPSATITDSGLVDPVAITAGIAFGKPTFSHASKVFTRGANVYIQGPAAASGGSSMTDAHALWIDDGSSRFEGAIEITTGGLIVAGGVQITSGDLDHDGTNVGLYGTTPAAQSAAYTRNATIVEDRTLLQSSAATTLNNNNVLAALIADLQSRGFIG